jgi:hypothetical protein
MSSTALSSSPSSYLAVAASSRMRRQRRNAISRAAESDWDAPSQTGPASPQQQPPWRRDDELVCPLASTNQPQPFAQLYINIGEECSYYSSAFFPLPESSANTITIFDLSLSLCGI